MRDTVIFGESIERERLRIDVLAVLHGLSLPVDHPVGAAVFGVPQMVGKELEGMPGGFQVGWIPVQVVSVGEGPQDARSQDAAFMGDGSLRRSIRRIGDP